MRIGGSPSQCVTPSVQNRIVPRPPLAIRMAAVSLTVLLPTACGGRGASNAGAEARQPGDATVVEVVDGDTIRVRVAGGGSGTESVRLIGIDTPETHGPGGLRECFGREATARTAELLSKDTAVRLVRDVEARDRYGRLLAYAYRKRDGLFVNLALAREGFAVVLTIPPNVAHTAELVDAAAAARRANRGLWDRCGGGDTPV